MVAWIGKWLFAVGVIHLSFGIFFMHTTLAVLWSEGLLNTVNGQPPREAVFLVPVHRNHAADRRGAGQPGGT
jgi:hypothetical protein